MKAYFLSDLHLKSMQERNSQTLLRFLHSVRDEQIVVNGLRDQSLRAVKGASDRQYVFLVGDIFDLWIGKHQYFVNRFREIVDAVRDLVKVGVEVHYFEGNHDLYLKNFWDDLGVVTHEDALTFELQGLKIRVEHGDLMNPDDRGYLFLRKFLRTPMMKLLARFLPTVIVSWIGEKASHASRDYTSTQKFLPEDQIRQIIRTHAIKTARLEPFDILVSGHVHVRDDYEFPMMRISDIEADEGASEANIRSVNLGSWFDEPKVFVIESGKGRFELLS